MLKTFPSVGVVVLKGDQVLLIVKGNHPKHAHQLPGGQIEQGETPVGAACRELEETTGLISKIEHFIKIPEEWEAVIQKTYGKAIFPLACFVCTDYSGQIKRTEEATSEWVALNKLDSMFLTPNTQNAINSALQLIEELNHKGEVQ